MAITSGTYASIPGSPASGDLYLLTDSFYTALRYNGSSWDHFIRGKQATTPPSFSWINQGTATVSTTNGGETLSDASAGSSHQLRVRKKAAPSTPYTVTVGLIPFLKGVNYSFTGLVFRESSSGKLRAFNLGFNANGFIEVVKWDSPTSPGAGLANIASGVLLGCQSLFWRLEDDGTNRKYHLSGDGINFVQIYSEGRTVDMTADEVGYFVNPYNQPVITTLTHWKEA